MGVLGDGIGWSRTRSMISIGGGLQQQQIQLRGGSTGTKIVGAAGLEGLTESATLIGSTPMAGPAAAGLVGSISGTDDGRLG